MLRSDRWMEDCQKAAVKAGAVGVFGYMHSLQKSIYTDTKTWAIPFASC